MRTLPSLFFFTAALFALCGMAWGIQMSASHDHSLSPAHGHLNLIGFVAMSIFGTFYALNERAAASGLAKLHYALAVATVIVLIPGIALAISERGEVLARIGSVMAVLTMATFAFVVARFGFYLRRPERARAQPAE